MALAGRILADRLSTVLFGDRKKFGISPDETDPDWLEWQDAYLDFYNSTQKAGIGRIVNDAGYSIMQDIQLEGLTVGDGWTGSPSSSGFLERKTSQIYRH